ncbi:hypothetical protein HMPREF0444_1502 [Granulicatella adiacens ATCC 49175]|uniref:Phage protein, HK97 gp10 family n=1 Tax=Granulicatella adiacens ATCC 49175 TaxID=638301 RepID=C8NHV7_9LACT|nr:hypothetical protein HMPREF0444_1502 [Granulicatella adiacens ATCC 49175]
MIILSYDLESEIAKALTNFSEDVAKEIDESVDELAEKTVSKLKSNSPKKTGDYASDWNTKKDKKGKRTIYQKEEYRIAHILEFGHAKKDGGRVPAITHIKPIEEEIIKEFEENIRRRLGN